MRIWKPLILLAVVAIVTAATLRLPGQPAEQPKTALLDVLKPGQPVTVKENTGRYEITVWPNQPLNHKVVAVGPDYVRVCDIAQVSDTMIPVYSISSIRIMRIGTR